MSDEVEIARLQFLERHAALRARICYFMIGAGIACLVAGIAMIVVGLTGQQTVWLETATIKNQRWRVWGRYDGGKRVLGIRSLQVKASTKS